MVSLVTAPQQDRGGHTLHMFSASIRKRLFKDVLISMAVNATIAATLTAFGKDSLGLNMLYSQLIGLSIWALIDGGRHVLHPLGHINMRQAMMLTFSGCVTGYFLGSAAGDVLRGFPPLHGWRHVPQQMAGFLLLSLAAGCAMVYFFLSREVLSIEKNVREQAERQAAQAKLKLLQSQLDPHMLFNTLANLRALIPQEPDRAVHMLDQLGDFLRATLSASNAQEHSLAAEFERLRDYLALMQIRLGDRLRYELSLPPELSQIHVPTLILQSLVENAVIHGIEPKIGGGQIWITAAKENGQLVLRVADDGMGLRADPAHGHGHAHTHAHHAPNGFGITQVRERLQNWYGSQNAINFIAVRAINTPANCSFSHQNKPRTGEQAPTPGCEVTLLLPINK